MVYRIWLRDMDLGNAISRLSWVKDGVDGYDEGDSLNALNRIATHEVQLASTIADLPWFVDGVSNVEAYTLFHLGNIVAEDLDIARTIVALPWFGGEVDVGEWQIVAAVNLIGSQDLELARKVARLPWLGDDVSLDERYAASFLADLASVDLQLAKTLASLPWFTDDVALEEPHAIAILSRIASTDPGLAKAVTNLRWFADDVTSTEREAIAYLGLIAHDLELAKTVAGLHWFVNARWSDLNRGILISLSDLANVGHDATSRLTAQPWFRDGLDDSESAFVVILGAIAERRPTLYRDLLGAHYVQKRTAALPLAGDVRIWVFQQHPFSSDDDTAETLEDTVRILEELLGVPFPTKDIILLVETSDGLPLGVARVNHGTHMWLIRTPDREFTADRDWKDLIHHATARYYFHSGPRWFVEGAAHIAEIYIDEREGPERFADRRANMTSVVQSRCVHQEGIENIRHNAYLNRFYPFIRACTHLMGESFMLQLAERIGEAAMLSVLGELYTSGIETGLAPNEEQIYDVFLNRVPANRKDDLRDLYRRLHGGQFAFPETDFSDDHGDEPSASTAIAVGEMAEGRLDYMFDFDYFRFRAEEGGKYRLNVDHETLRVTSLILYAPDGLTPEWENRDNWRYYVRAPSGPELFWTAPSSDEYYVAVHNFGGRSGSYTLSVTAVKDVADDHGDSPADATDLSDGEAVEGNVDGAFDVDYFRFQASEGQRYRGLLVVGLPDPEHSVWGYLGVEMYLPDGVTPVEDGETVWTLARRTATFEWAPSNSGDYHLAIQGRDGYTGTYTLTIFTAEDEADE